MFRNRVIEEMKKVYSDNPDWITHTLDVLNFADLIAEGEDIDVDTRQLIAIVAILHDIGVIDAQLKYGSMAPIHQEKTGPVVARRILENAGYNPAKIERVCYIIGHHHTPSAIDGIDFQVQWEADMLVNLKGMDVRNNKNALPSFIDVNFKTRTGRNLAIDRYLGPS